MQDIRRWGGESCHWASGTLRIVPAETQLQRITRERKSSGTATSFIGYSCFDMCKGRRQRAGRDGGVSEQGRPLCGKMHSGTCAGGRAFGAS